MVTPDMGDGKCKISTFQDSNPNTVSILLLIPQFAVITIAEVLISVTGLEFAYTQDLWLKILKNLNFGSRDLVL